MPPLPDYITLTGIVLAAIGFCWSFYELMLGPRRIGRTK